MMWNKSILLGIFLLLVGNGESLTIDLQPEIIYIPAKDPTEVVITCTGNSGNVDLIFDISLERTLARDDNVTNLVSMSDELGPKLDDNAPQDLLDRNPSLQGYFQRNETSSFFTLSFNMTEPEGADAGDYTCVMSYQDTSFVQITARQTATTEVQIDECLSPSACAIDSTCTNTNGNYTCMCNDGFSGDGNDECVDIDDCLWPICANNALCTNTEGSYECTCDVGFAGDGKDICTDIDECLLPSICANNATCTNTEGSYECTCDVGFAGDGKDNCTDIDECLWPSICANNATCTNTEGSYECTCDVGFAGDGKDNCTETELEINFCVPEPCQNGVCNSSSEGFTCICNAGYTGLTCDTDVNECLNTPCAANAKCTNSQGSYRCKCYKGYKGDGNVKCARWK